jgi:hypothetical protein
MAVSGQHFHRDPGEAAQPGIIRKENTATGFHSRGQVECIDRANAVLRPDEGSTVVDYCRERHEPDVRQTKERVELLERRRISLLDRLDAALQACEVAYGNFVTGCPQGGETVCGAHLKWTDVIEIVDQDYAVAVN